MLQKLVLRGDKLPDKIQLLIDRLNEHIGTNDDAPCFDEEADAVLGVTVEPKPEKKSVPPRLLAEGETVYARQELEPDKTYSEHFSPSNSANFFQELAFPHKDGALPAALCRG